MYNGKIQIHNIEAAREFVALTAKYPKLKIMLTCEEYEVDAHSIIGILSLDLSQPLDICAQGEDVEKYDTLLSLAVTGGDYTWI